MDYRIIIGDALSELRKLDSQSVQTCITSPPYYEVAVSLGRSAIGIELSEDYAELARRRLAGVTPAMF